jgi:hypothetical protein
VSSLREITDGLPLVTFELAAQATPGDTSTTTVTTATVPFDGTVVKVEIVPRAAITANATNFAVYTLQNRGGNLAGSTAVASRSWAATNSVAATKEQATLNATPANREVKAGDQFQLVRSIGGTGLATPAISFIITMVPR